MLYSSNIHAYNSVYVVHTYVALWFVQPFYCELQTSVLRSSHYLSSDLTIWALLLSIIYHQEIVSRMIIDIVTSPQAFSNMTSNIRQALFQVLMLQTFENEGSIVIDNGEEVCHVI